MSSPNLIPSVYEGILFQSRLNPNAIAVSVDGREITYRTFCADVEKVTRHLRGANLVPGSRVAVHVHQQYLRWLVILGLARMGVVSVSVTESARELDFLKVQRVVSDRPAALPGRDAIEAGARWLGPDADALPPFEDTRFERSAPCRMVVSSGTTGTPKKAILSYGDIRDRIRGTARMHGLNTTARLLTTMGTATIGGFMMLIACWSGGGTVVLASFAPEQPMSDLLLHRANVLMLSTGQLSALMDALPKDYWPWQQPQIFVAGSTLPPALSRAARLRLSQSLFVMYGSTEAGGIAVTHASLAEERPGFIGYVLSTAEVQIVDEQGNQVPHGTMGEMRMRAEGMVDGYADEPGVTDEAYRDGWFYPGDAGMFDAQGGGLTILGRTRELMNLGGVKIAPELIEQALSACPGIQDMAVFALGEEDRQRPWVAIVPGDGFADEPLQQAYTKAFPRLPKISIARIDKIQRNEMGKVMRNQLQATVQRALERKGA
ncbi:class I adenylate-forming enzyme family protein [Caenimonas aquaedulcis]|uniref:Acyl--CoA ligase n=1 Tax=Caenimonas aquaedulcis TaxID=2793270 RepID=A0A931H2N4_9BURK|nr:class I adenylate-forming enzyme family protein [Caenimonas aquaedulcis]MBG9387457.1 acyl--CoA ligase [Caenimonas aquaedulcis]